MFLLYLLGCRTCIQFDFLSVLVVFVFKLLLSFFWLCDEALCVYLHLHLGWKSFDLFFHLGLFFFFLSRQACYIKVFTGWGEAGLCAVTLYVGEGLRGSNGAPSTLCGISVTPSATHNQIGPFWC